MVIGGYMTTQNYLVIEENVVTNIVLWDGDTNTWTPSVNAIMLVKETTPTKIWDIDSTVKDYVLVDSIGNADIGFTYDGSFCTTNEQKPDAPRFDPKSGQIPITTV